MKNVETYADEEVEEIEVPSEEDNYALDEFSREQIIKIIEVLGYEPKQARDIAMDTQGVASDRWLTFHLYEAFKRGALETLPILLKSQKLEIIPIDNCQIVFIKHKKPKRSSEEYINWFRKSLGPFIQIG